MPGPCAGFGLFSRRYDVGHVMTAHPSALDAWVRPHQIEVQEFGSYALVIDARARAPFDEDHLPGAVNLPVDESARRAKRQPQALTALVAGLSRDDRVLVYCDRGGLDSAVWAEPLRAAGWSVDVLPGGWPNYRRWVSAGLEILPRVLYFRVLRAPPFSGVDCVLAALENDGQQVLDLVALAEKNVWPGMSSTAESGISQSAFESAVLHALRFCDPERDVWVSELVLSATDTLSIPVALNQKLCSSASVFVETPLAHRVQCWQQTLAERGMDIEGVITRFAADASLPAQSLIARWRGLASTDAPDAVLAAILQDFVDRRYAAFSSKFDRSSIEGTLSIDTLQPLRGSAPDADPVLRRLFTTGTT